MNGIDMLKEIMRRQRVPVIVFSSHSTEGATVTLKALGLGAFDFVAKPTMSPHAWRKWRAELIAKIKAAAQSRGLRPSHAAGIVAQRAGKRPLDAKRAPTRMVAIGVSTGGPQALHMCCRNCPADFPGRLWWCSTCRRDSPTCLLAAWMNVAPLRVKEAQSGDLLQAGRVLICPGNRHMKVKRLPLGDVACLSDDPRVNGHRPSCRRAVQECGRRIRTNGVGVLMTGMGEDGAEGLGAIKEAGGMTIAQSEESCVVYGMPKAAIERGYAIEWSGWT